DDIGDLQTSVGNLEANGCGSGTGADSLRCGAGATASGDQSTALGTNATASHSNSLALGSGSQTDRDNAVSVGVAGGERQITNVADATQAQDALTLNQGGQLASALGGGTAYDANGQLIAPTYNVAGGS